jgi:hypothetical protein
MNKLKTAPARSRFSIFRQVCKLIPEHMVSKIARTTGAEEKSRTFTPWSHVVSLIYAQLTHSIGLNDLCDSLQLHSGPLSGIRGATPPSRNGLSNANRERPAEMGEELFWQMLTHMRLSLQSLLPNFVIIDTAGEHDNKRARELCAEVQSGEIVLFDKGYVDFGHLRDLDGRGVFWVTRAKDNMAYEVVKAMPPSKDPKILRDEIIQLSNPNKPGPELMRRVVALVEVDEQEREMTFLTNNLEWSPRSVADLYRCRWQIEVFFKQIKQTLQLGDFLGHNANAIRWQVWMALLVYVLLRYLSYVSNWSHSFTRLFTILRAVMWSKLDLLKLLDRYGTAKGSFRNLARPDQAYFPGFL